MSKSKKSGKAPPETKKRFPVIWVLVSVLVLGAIAWTITVIVEGAERREVLRRLPPQPDMSLYSDTLRALVNQAEADLPDGPLDEGLGHLGSLYLANYFYVEAAKCYELAREVEPEDARWPYLLAYVRTMMGDTSGAMALFDETIERNPRYVPARLRRADNLYKSRDLDAAEQDYARCLELEPSNQYAALGLGRIALDREEWERAEEMLQCSIEADPSFGAAHRLMAIVHERFGRTEEQERELRIAEECGRFFPAPDPWIDDLEQLCFHSDKLLTKGYMAERYKKYDIARSLYERIIDIEPENFTANFRLATVLQSLGERDKAEALYERALELEATDESRYTVIHSNLGELYFKKGDIDRAVESLNKAIELDPEFFAAHLSLGAVLTHQDSPAQAIEHCRKALDLNPESDAAHFNWGLALLRQEKTDEAMGHFEQATQLNPDFALAHYQLGVYYLRNGETETGAQYLRRALEAAEKTGNRGLIPRIQQALSRAAA